MSTWPWWVNWYLFVALAVAVVLLFRKPAQPGLTVRLPRAALAAITWPVLLFVVVRGAFGGAPRPPRNH